MSRTLACNPESPRMKCSWVVALMLGAALLTTDAGAAEQPAVNAKAVPTASAAIVRFDGIYYSRDPQGRGDYYLRFYADGTVVSVTSTGSPVQVASWLNPGNENVGKGIYQADGKLLRFTEETKTGAVDYAGTMAASTLDLQLTSRINGHWSRRTFVFVADPSSTFGPLDAVPLDMKPPEYPKSEIPNNRDGKIVLLVDVSAIGSVSAATVESSSGVAAFDEAAVQQAKQWSFVPARDAQGRPAFSRLRIPLEFKSPGRNLSERVKEVLSQRCSAVNEEVARLSPNPGGKKPSNGATIDDSLAWVLAKQMPLGLTGLPGMAEVPSVPAKNVVSFYREFPRLIDGIKASCAAQPTAVYGDVLRQELEALTKRAR